MTWSERRWLSSPKWPGSGAGVRLEAAAVIFVPEDLVSHLSRPWPEPIHERFHNAELGDNKGCEPRSKQRRIQAAASANSRKECASDSGGEEVGKFGEA
jgi:hypothetical protein